MDVVEPRVSLVTLGVSDLPRARAFYEALGWGPGEQSDDGACFFQAGGMVLGLWTELGGRPIGGVELAYNVRQAGEVGPVLDEAVAAGGTLVRPATPTEWGGTAGAFADPDGHVWEVAHNPFWPIADDGSVHLR
jgi:catechol 2,3-dioxygenase-like lactoylglutathione lyase family enzyme